MTTPSATALRSHGHTRPHSRSGGACYLPIKFEIRDVHTHKGITKALLFSQEIIKAETYQLGVVQNQFTLGAAARADVLTQQSEVATTRATLRPALASTGPAASSTKYSPGFMVFLLPPGAEDCPFVRNSHAGHTKKIGYEATGLA